MLTDSVFITGIGTGIGKTFVSAVLTCGLNARYWKPIQAGTIPETDTECVKRLTGLSEDFFIPEYKILKTPVSPHLAIRLEGSEFNLTDILVPENFTNLVIEGAGGVLVPLSEQALFADLIALWGISSVIVAGNYLGSINHTLMTIEVMQNRKLPIKGLIFTGESNAESEALIESYSGIKILGKIPYCVKPDSVWIQSAFQKYISWE